MRKLRDLLLILYFLDVTAWSSFALLVKFLKTFLKYIKSKKKWDRVQKYHTNEHRGEGRGGGMLFCNKCPSLHFYALQPFWHTSNEYIMLFFGKIEYFTKRHLYNSKDDNWLTSESCNKAWISKSIIKILWWKRRNIFWGIAQYKKQKRNNAKKAITF